MSNLHERAADLMEVAARVAAGLNPYPGVGKIAGHVDALRSMAAELRAARGGQGAVDMLRRAASKAVGFLASRGLVGGEGSPFADLNIALAAFENSAAPQAAGPDVAGLLTSIRDIRDDAEATAMTLLNSRTAGWQTPRTLANRLTLVLDEWSRTHAKARGDCDDEGCPHYGAPHGHK